MEPKPKIDQSLPDTRADELKTQGPDWETDAEKTRGSNEAELIQASKTGVSVSGYRILQRIGEGGMGLVYLADQLVPVKRRVALKVVKWGADSKEVIARFEAERQALAIMDHPGIAKILDAGTTDSGQPYFAMELVLGPPITNYCDSHNLGIEGRLELFASVCEAVHHAHQKGIIHRDLKPSNLLVAELHDKPVPKIIDFGLAKALDATHKLSDKTVFTEFGQILGTLKYMSPEQAGLNSLDIDTRTDVYALGIVLYELLTGGTPLDDESLRDKSVIELLALVREHESPKPSSRLSTTGKEMLDQITSRRQTDRKRLSQQLTGDLDWIVVKALEKERSRRYDSAARFAEDIRRYLNHEPVEARPPSLLYRSSKFMRKHRGIVAALAIVFLSLIVGISAATWFAIDANQARKSAVQAAETARQNEATAIANRQEALNAIDEFFTTVSEEELLDSPGLQPLRSKLLKKAYEYYDALLADSEADISLPLLIEAQTRYANILGKLGDDVEAASRFRAAISEIDRINQGAINKEIYASLLFNAYAGAARTAQRLGDLETSGQYLDELFSRMQEVAIPEIDKGKDGGGLNIWMAETYLAMASLDQSRGRVETARERLLQAQSLVQPLSEVEDSDKLESLRATILEELAATAPDGESFELMTKAIETRRVIYRKNPSKLENGFLLGGDLMSTAFRRRLVAPEESLEMFGEAESILEKLNQENPDVASYRQSFARCLDLHAFTLHQYSLQQDLEPEALAEALGRSLALYDRAEKVLREPFLNSELRDAVKRMQPRAQSLLALIYNGKALVRRDLVQRDTGEVDSSIQEYEIAMQIQSVVVEQSPGSVRARQDVAGTWHNIGRTLAHVNRYEEAAEKFGKSVQLFEAIRQEFPQENSTLPFLANTRGELNRMLFFIGDVERLRTEFQSTTAAWKEAIEKTGQEQSGPLLLSRIEDALFQTVENDLTEIDALVPELIERVEQDASAAYDAAEMMMGLVKVPSGAGKLDEATTKQLRAYAEQLITTLLAADAITQDELAKSSLLKDL